MTRHHTTLALVALLGSAPLLSSSLALAAPEHPTISAPAGATRMMDRALDESTPTASPRGDLTPSVPLPMTLPDEATADEVQTQYAFGIASLVLAAVLVMAIMHGVFYFLARGSWSTSH